MAAQPPSGAESDAPRPEPSPAAARSRRPRAVRAALIALSVVLLAELFTRAIASELLPPESNGAGEVALKADQLERLAEAGGVDLLVIGDSMVDAGIDPAAVAAEVPALPRSYNAALRGARLPTQRLWLTEVVLPRVRPRLVLHGVSPTVVSNLGVSPTDVDVFDTMLNNNVRQLNRDFWGELESIAAERSYLVRYRPSLRSPTIVWNATRNKVTGTSSNLTVDRGPEYWTRITTSTGQNNEYFLGVAKPEALTGLFPVITKLLEGSLHFETLDRLFALYEAEHLPVILVVPPVAVDLLRQGGVDPARWQAAADQIVARGKEHGIVVLDFVDRGYGSEDFYDLFHLNARGSKKFSADLGDAVAAQCRADARLGCG